MLLGRAVLRGCSQQAGRCIQRGSTRAASTAAKGPTKRPKRRPTRQKSILPGIGAAAVAGGVGVGAYVYFTDSDSGDVLDTESKNGAHNPAKEGGGTFVGFVHDLLNRMRGVPEDPAAEALLPDWENSVLYQENAPKPLTLVLDLEETLGTSTWDRRHGWRFAKRPGLDRFLVDMMQSGYEVVVFSTNPSVGPVEDMFALLDPSNELVPYKLYCNHAEFKDNRYVKNLDKLNRDFSKVIVVDDNLDDVSHNENCIQIKAFDDHETVEDDTLPRLSILLQTLAAKHYNGKLKDTRQELAHWRPKPDAGAEEPQSLLDNFMVFLDRQQASKKKAEKSGLAGLLRKAQMKKKEAAAGSPGTNLGVPGVPGAGGGPGLGLGLGGAVEPGSLAGLSPNGNPIVGRPSLNIPKVAYRKTIWERFTDPAAAAKADRELQATQDAWKQHVQEQGRQ